MFCERCNGKIEKKSGRLQLAFVAAQVGQRAGPSIPSRQHSDACRRDLPGRVRSRAGRQGCTYSILVFFQ